MFFWLGYFQLIIIKSGRGDYGKTPNYEGCFENTEMVVFDFAK